ncbi:MAG: hypothetical protein HZB50_11640 [Chloroflexi bacterium]|nr:hypothetical protein [Chloroflexota bacterium]
MKFRNSLWLAGTMILAIVMSSCSLGATPAPTQDTGAIQTQAVSIALTQVSMQQTQTAMAIPPTPMPTNTLLPTPTLGVLPTFAPVGTVSPLNTALPGMTPLGGTPFATLGSGAPAGTTKNGCNDGAFEYDNGAAVVDWTVLKPKTEYTHGWSIINTGTCDWDEGYSFFLMKDISSPLIDWKQTIITLKDPSEFTKPKSSQLFVLHFVTPRDPGRYEAFWKLKDDKGNIFGPQVWIRFEIK